MEKLQLFDDFNADEKLQDRERLFEVDVFKANVDVITTQLKNRFEKESKGSQTLQIWLQHDRQVASLVAKNNANLALSPRFRLAPIESPL
ncbi:hypothetical protein TNCV_2061891 [Trichonephila clavipes]|nr:hypothetical protein TNCV_2061891 [Trichonephila clavipes]